LYWNRDYVPNSQELGILVLKEMHRVPYVVHLGYQKTIVVVRAQCYWPRMKKDVVDFIARCMESQRVKDEHGNKRDYYIHCPFQSGNGRLLP
jgi:hypothetical protein